MCLNRILVTSLYSAVQAMPPGREPIGDRSARGGLTITEVAAGHVDILVPPHNKVLAERFDACLRAIQHQAWFDTVQITAMPASLALSCRGRLIR